MVHDTIPVKPHTSTITGNQPIFPPNLTIPVNSDASWFQESSAAGFGWGLEESQRGILIEGSTHSDFVSSPFVAESLQYSTLLTSECDPTISSLLKLSTRSLFLWNFTEFSRILSIYLYLSISSFFSHVQRSCNVLADSLARNGLLFATPLCIKLYE